MEELVRLSNDKKTFVRTLAEIFTLLLTTNVGTVNKISKIGKIAIETTLKICKNQSNSKKVTASCNSGENWK